MDDSRLVYSTEPGRVAKEQPKSNKSRSGKKVPTGNTAQPHDGIIRIRREVKGRKGKQVTVVLGLPADDDTLKQAATRLKRICGSGGSVKDGCIIIQGDHRKKVQSELIKLGYQAKMI
jgi:translation initiation factor 1